jgi:hypothetical protein
MAIESVTATEYVSRIRALLGRSGITAGFPRRARDRRILLHAIASRFDPDERLGEIEATQRIGGFLVTAAAPWRMDRVNLRRALVDEGFLDRDPGGANYRRSDRYQRRIRFEEVPAIEAILGDRSHGGT